MFYSKIYLYILHRILIQTKTLDVLCYDKNLEDSRKASQKHESILNLRKKIKHMKNILSGRLVTDIFYHGPSLALVWSKFRFHGWRCAPSGSANHASKKSSDYKRVKSLFINWSTHVMYRYSLFFSKQACCFYWKWTPPAKSSWNFAVTGFI